MCTISNNREYATRQMINGNKQNWERERFDSLYFVLPLLWRRRRQSESHRCSDTAAPIAHQIRFFFVRYSMQQNMSSGAVTNSTKGKEWGEWRGIGSGTETQYTQYIQSKWKLWTKIYSFSSWNCLPDYFIIVSNRASLFHSIHSHSIWYFRRLFARSLSFFAQLLKYVHFFDFALAHSRVWRRAHTIYRGTIWIRTFFIVIDFA